MSFAALDRATRREKGIDEPCHRPGQRADRIDPAGAGREQQRGFRRNAVIAEQRNRGEFGQAQPATAVVTQLASHPTVPARRSDLAVITEQRLLRVLMIEARAKVKGRIAMP